MAAEFASVMAGAASAHQAASATREDTSQQRAGRTRRTRADPQRAQQRATAAAADAPAALQTLSRLQQLANASPQVAQLRRLQAMADCRNATVAQFVGGPEEEELVQGKFATAELPAQLQQSPRANNTGLPDQLKSGIESLSGLSMDHVRVHYNSSQPAQLNALAYAQGSDIHLAPGQEQHLPHEAWHVVQQAQGRVRPTLQMQEGVPVNDDVGLEREADVMGAKALKKKQKVNNTILNAVQGGGSADAVQQKTEKNANTDISDCLEEDIESHTTGPVRSEIKDIALEREDDEPPYSDEEAMAQTQVTQLQPSRRRSNRIATNLQNQARRTRRNRLGRHRGIVRLVPGGPVRTRRMRVAALGGRYGLLCPVGSYAQVRRNFNYTGSRAGDAAALGGTPPGHVWHHYHDFVPSATPNAGHGTMYLLRIEQHLPRHLGGVYQWNHTPGNRRYG